MSRPDDGLDLTPQPHPVLPAERCATEPTPTGTAALARFLDLKAGLTIKQLIAWTLGTAMFVATAVRMEVAVTGTYNRLEAAEREIALTHRDVRALARAVHAPLPSEHDEASAPALGPVSITEHP